MPVVTPANFLEWCNHIGHRRFRCGFRECFSGSGRLSFTGYLQLLCIAPPLDYRYGWDLRSAQHQTMVDASFLDEASASWYSPKCSPWIACSGWRASRQTVGMKRKHEAPTLKWIANKFAGKGSAKAQIIEQPSRSQMFTASCLASSPVGSEISTTMMDQCQYGAVLEEKNKGKIPIQKTTKLRSVGIHFSAAMRKRCRGNQACPQHQPLSGRGKFGVPRTALAAVYPRLFCVQVMREVAAHICRQLTNVPR